MKSGTRIVLLVAACAAASTLAIPAKRDCALRMVKSMEFQVTKAPRTETVRETATPAIPTEHTRAMASSGLTAGAARERADKLLIALDTLLIAFRENTATLDLGNPADYPAVDRIIDATWAALNDPALLDGTGYRVSEYIPTMGSSDLTQWVRDAKDVERLSPILAARAQLIPGGVRYPSFIQNIPVGGRANYITPRSPGDRNYRGWYVEEILLAFEMNYYVVQYLRIFGGVTGTNINVSEWARTSDLPYRVNLGADTLACLVERYGPLPPYWGRNFPARAAVPLMLPLRISAGGG